MRQFLAPQSPCEVVNYYHKACDAKSYKEGEVLVVGVFGGACQGALVDDELLVAFLDHVAGAYAEERVFAERTPCVLPQLESLQHGEVLHGAGFAVAFMFKQHHVVHLFQRVAIDVDGVGNAFLYGLDVGSVEKLNACAVFRCAEGVEVPYKGEVDAVFVGGQVVETCRAAFGPFTLQLLAADVVVYVVAVLYKSVVFVGVVVAVRCLRREFGGGHRHHIIVAVNHRRRRCDSSHYRGAHQGCGADFESFACDAFPEGDENDGRGYKENGKACVGAKLEEEVQKRDYDDGDEPCEPVAETCFDARFACFPDQPFVTLGDEPDGEDDGQADVEGEAYVRYVRNYVAVGKVGNGGHADPANDGGDKDRGGEEGRRRWSVVC